MQETVYIYRGAKGLLCNGYIWLQRCESNFSQMIYLLGNREECVPFYFDVEPPTIKVKRGARDHSDYTYH